MGFWPFGTGKRQRASEAEERTQTAAGQRRSPTDMANTEKPAYGSPPTRRRSTKEEDQSLRTAANLQHPTRKPTKPGSTARSYRNSVPDMADMGPTMARQPLIEKAMYQHNPLSQSSIGPEDFSVVRQAPTLFAKRQDYDPNIPRRKSSKRKAEDYAREREVRAMSSSASPVPKRPATFSGSGPLARDTRQIPGDMNRRLTRPASQISLPYVESLSDEVDPSHQNSFKVSMLAALSPRPTVKYDANPRKASGKQVNRSRTAIRQAIAEDDVSDKKRIDELADDLDAGGLRELMERDRRRRERKKDVDRAKLQRRLQRRADRQKEEETARRVRTEEYVEHVKQSAPKGEPSRTRDARQPFDPGAGSDTDPFADPQPRAEATPTPHGNPFADEQEMDVVDGQTRSDDDRAAGQKLVQGPAIPPRSELRKATPVQNQATEKQSHATLSPPVSPVQRASDRQSLSQASMLNREVTLDVPEGVDLDRRASDQSSQRLSSWTNFFRRGTRTKTGTSFQGGRRTPSEFSNTSRESFARKPPPVAVPRTFRRADSATPQRTMSKFREDLPELPMSPPDSRVHSPEATVAPANRSLVRNGKDGAEPVSAGPDVATSATSASIPIGGRVNRQERKRSMEFDSPSGYGAALSQSLASVDSEGSWLSGKALKRPSGSGSGPGPPPLRRSRSSLHRHVPGAFETEDEDGSGVMFARRPRPEPDDRLPSVTATGPNVSENRADIKGEPGPHPTEGSRDDETWHAGLGRQPMVVRQTPRAKSKEGLLKEYTAGDEEDSSGETDEEHDENVILETPDVELREAPIMRAKSVEYKGHIRHVSAGSAKLLDIRRSSTHSESSNLVLTPARRSAQRLAEDTSSPTQPEQP